ncbi:tRNA uracil 4-sulfurtransferase ThiI [Nitrincola sp. MINF-07-Sa-05]|uniref:tRNA uracil 4-sulfurtransferase ThiI n=1 Tax=Nitrincola salilacus TaxID=3400273 RepID=UPI00391834C3
MKFIVRLFAEITIKTRPVRNQQIRQLKKNIRTILSYLDEGVEVSGNWDMIEVTSSADASAEVNAQISDTLTCIPGISYFLEAREYLLEDFDTICRQTLSEVGDSLRGKSFSVRVHRTGHHDFRSIDLERYVGGYLNQNTDNGGVKLKDPDIQVMLQINHDRLFIVSRRREGMGGYPLGSQEAVATLISGGFDSSVATYQMLQRGICTHFIFFSLGGRAHEEGVKQIAYHIWKRYGASHNVRFVTVPFEGVVENILTQVHNSQMGVVLKRQMMKCADKIADHLKATALVTGEAISQVSSQTLTNLQVIDRSIDRLILRPLIATNKQRIVDEAKRIGTADFAAAMPEYCGVISRKPTTRAKLQVVEAEESKLDPAVIEAALKSARYQPISKVMEDFESLPDVRTADITVASELPVTIIDLRAPDEVEAAPLAMTDYDQICVPFYQLHSRFAELDQSREYWLYCDRGVMSRLQAVNLLDAGFSNVKLCPAEIVLKASPSA